MSSHSKESHPRTFNNSQATANATGPLTDGPELSYYEEAYRDFRSTFNIGLKHRKAYKIERVHSDQALLSELVVEDYQLSLKIAERDRVSKADGRQERHTGSIGSQKSEKAWILDRVDDTMFDPLSSIIGQHHWEEEHCLPTPVNYPTATAQSSLWKLAVSGCSPVLIAIGGTLDIAQWRIDGYRAAAQRQDSAKSSTTGLTRHGIVEKLHIFGFRRRNSHTPRQRQTPSIASRREARQRVTVGPTSIQSRRRADSLVARPTTIAL